MNILIWFSGALLGEISDDDKVSDVSSLTCEMLSIESFFLCCALEEYFDEANNLGVNAGVCGLATVKDGNELERFFL